MYSEVTDEDIKKLKLLEPKAAVLTSLDCSDTDTASESDKENEDPLEPLAALYDENLRGHSSHRSVNLECITKNQAQSQAWQTHRIGRIPVQSAINISTKK